MEIPKWVADARELPLGFAQVREDPRIDRHVVEQCGSGARVAMIASGGCTAALLAALPEVSHLTIVDPNPAQLELARLKLALLACPQDERLQLLGHRAMDPDRRLARLNEVGVDLSILGPRELVGAHGPDKCGRYERLFGALQQVLGGAVTPGQVVSPEVEQVLNAAFAEVMALPNLVALFGEGATRNPRMAFDRHFARRTLEALRAPKASENPFLWQVLQTCFAPARNYDWLELPVVEELPEIRFVNAAIDDALDGAGQEFHVVHLSNVLDWLSPEDAFATLERSWKALRPGGYVLIRQLNSTLQIEGLGARFRWRVNEARDWLARDRSYFYRGLFIGVRP